MESVSSCKGIDERPRIRFVIKNHINVQIYLFEHKERTLTANPLTLLKLIIIITIVNKAVEDNNKILQKIDIRISKQKERSIER